MNLSATEESELRKFLFQAPHPLKERVPTKSQKKKVIVLSGPTAVGKTRLSLAVAKSMGAEIISADSMQVYRGMDIGTAKVKEEDKGGIAHHLIDIRDLSQRFSVMEFCNEAHKAIRNILLRGQVPIVVGGTGFYIHALIFGPPQGPPSVPEVRDRLEREMEQEGLDALYARLLSVDPKYAQTITGADRHKIIRALEIIALTDKKVSDFPKGQKREIPYDYRCFFLHTSRQTLYQNIEMRCDEMIADGLIDEVKHLEEQGLRKNSAASQAIGYRQCLEFLASERGAKDFETFVAAFKRASRRYAKRQFTWFKKESLFRWLNVESLPFDRVADVVIQDYELSF